jgi:16S rRNA (cytosine967-C5)-methyltransferase
MAKLVRPGGRLVYATCSLSRRENQEVVAAFLATQPDFTEVAPTGSCGGAAGAPGLVFLPAQHNTDGFYVATLRRR